MIWEKFKDNFHESWWEHIKPFIESEECDRIYEFLKKESRRGVKIVPSSLNTYRVFKEVPLEEIRCVILSYCPYHTITKEGIPVADGIAFSCSITEKLQPSLSSFYEGLEQDLYKGLNLNFERDPDLTYLLKQGVFLWNSSLTTEVYKPGKHQELWRPFTKYILEKVLIYRNLPFILIGKDAQFYSRYITPLTHGPIFQIEHPSFAARNHEKWQTQGVFSKINSILGDKYISWLSEPADDSPPF